jgi:hypothetical protein
MQMAQLGRPQQRMRAVLLISIVGLGWHRFASSGFKGFLVPSFIYLLLGDVMVTVWGQKDVHCDRFPSSNLVPLNNPRRNALESIFSFFTSLKFFDQTWKSKTHVPEKNGGKPLPRPFGPIGSGRPACPCSRVDSVRFFTCSTVF